jgi:acetyltransferase-like isoleucine patch superfamily enzyme
MLKALIKKCIRIFRNRIKRIQFYALGFTACDSTDISWSVSADGGGGGGSIFVGDNSTLDRGVILRAYGGFIRIGDNSTINPYCLLHGTGGLTIGNGVRIASHTVVVAANHNFSNTSKFIYLQGETALGIIIEDDVWIGAGVTILDGVTIRKGSVIGAGSVVTRSTDPYSINVGVPTKAIGSRTNC